VHEPAPKKFDPQTLISAALQALQHWRLVVIMLAIGLQAGAIYFMFSRPTFFSRALVDVKIFGSPITPVGGDEGASGPSYLIKHGLMTELTSMHLVLKTARKLGLVGMNDSYETVRDEHVPRVDVIPLDSNNVEIYTTCYMPEVAREFPKALVDAYLTTQRESLRDMREQAIARYTSELGELQEMVNKTAKQASDYDSQNELTRTFIEVNKLTRVPVEIVSTQEQIAQIEALPLPSIAIDKLTFDQVIEELSKLSLVQKQSTVNVGDMVAAATAPLRLPSGTGVTGPAAAALAAATTNQASTRVIVQPNMVDTVDPWRALEKEYRDTSVELVEAQKTYLSGHVVIKAILEKRASLESSLRAALQVARNQHVVDLQRKKERLEELKAQLPEYKDISEKYEQFRRHSGLMDQGNLLWDNAVVAMSGKLSSVEYELNKNRVELAFKGYITLRDLQPISPNKTKLMLISLLLGFGGGFGLISLMKLFNSSTSRLADLESITGLKGLGVVPFTSKKDREDVFRAPAVGSTVPNSLLESFRLIRSQILLDDAHTGGCQVVMVTSARPSEGKTSLASNLAWAFYSMGEKTLLVDCDMRRGRVHQVTGSTNELGLSTLLTGRSTSAESIQASKNENLDILTRGPIIVGATDKLVQADFDALIGEWRTKYPRIILDCPPTLGLSETATISRVADGTLLVVLAEKTARKDVVDAVELLRKTGSNLVGFVLNALDLKKLANSYQYYYYSAAYYDSFDDADEPVKAPAARTAR
jgi:polysaccharide biosynthesis transport protein